MTKESRSLRIFLYCLGVILALVSIPLGNSLRDWGIIHTLGIISGLFVFAGVYWELFGNKSTNK